MLHSFPPLSVPDPGLLRWHGPWEGRATFQKDPPLWFGQRNQMSPAAPTHTPSFLPAPPGVGSGPGPQHHVLQLESDPRGDPND